MQLIRIIQFLAYNIIMSLILGYRWFCKCRKSFTCTSL